MLNSILHILDNHPKGHAGGNNAENDAESLLRQGLVA